MSEPVPLQAAPARRAPFSDNPAVGHRGQRTQQRILDAALGVFADEGYHQASVGRITARAGCSRAAFYQYFSDKEQVFLHLVGQVVRQVSASIEALGPITADAAGWTTIRDWITRYHDTFDRYGPVFHTFSSAEERDEDVHKLRMSAAAHNIGQLHAKVQGTDLADRDLDIGLGMLLEAAARVYFVTQTLRNAGADYLPERVENAMADVAHRYLFGLLPGINDHRSDQPPAVEIDFASLPSADDAGSLTEVGRGTLDTLMTAGFEVFVARGYHATRVDDIVAAAGLSHGAFYRYFTNKAHFARTLVLHAMEPLSGTLAAIPQTGLRAWLRQYNEVQVSEAAIIRIWVDATLHEPELSTDAAAALDWGRRRMARYLGSRDFGDHDAEAIVLMAVLEAFGARRRQAPIIDVTAHLIERGLLGR